MKSLSETDRSSRQISKGRAALNDTVNMFLLDLKMHRSLCPYPTFIHICHVLKPQRKSEI